MIEWIILAICYIGITEIVYLNWTRGSEGNFIEEKLKAMACVAFLGAMYIWIGILVGVLIIMISLEALLIILSIVIGIAIFLGINWMIDEILKSKEVRNKPSRKRAKG